MEYYTCEKISERITRIRDLSRTAAYLVEGREQACLIDTGCGVGPLRPLVERLTRKPYFVILTHGHMDHAGGAGAFADRTVYLHPDDRTLMDLCCTSRKRLDYLQQANPAVRAAETDCRPALPAEKTCPLHHGQTFDLGGLTLEIIHTPGHTQGMCMVLMREERTILFGDGCGVCVLLLDEFASTVEAYLHTLEQLKAYEPRYDRILRNHGSCESPKSLLDGVIDCCRCILDGTDDHVPAEHLPTQTGEAYFAKKTEGIPPRRVDGGEGNLAYTPAKIR